MTMTAPFASRIYALLRTVPTGKVTTYKDLANALNSSAYRAVGQAMRTNPDAPRTPCHRVVASDSSIGGFSGEWGEGEAIKRKIALLKKEGVIVENGKVQDFARLRHRF